MLYHGPMRDSVADGDREQTKAGLLQGILQ